MAGSGDLETPKRQTLARVLAWIASFLLLLVCLYTTLGLLRAFMLWGGGHWNVNAHDFKMMREFVERLAVLIMAIVVLALTVYFEYRYRDGAEKGILGQRVIRVIGIEVAVIGVTLLVQFLF